MANTSTNEIAKLLNRIQGHDNYTVISDFFEMSAIAVRNGVDHGLVAYDAPVRLYHYHIKSLDDWKHKLARGSAANTAQIYDEDITKNKWYGDYSVIDLTMLNTAKKIGLL